MFILAISIGLSKYFWEKKHRPVIVLNFVKIEALSLLIQY